MFGGYVKKLYICGRLAENVTETRNKYDRKPKQYVYEKLFIHFFEKWKDEFFPHDNYAIAADAALG